MRRSFKAWTRAKDVGSDDEYVPQVIYILTFTDGFYFSYIFFWRILVDLMVEGIATCLMAIMNVYSSWSLLDSVDGSTLRIDQGLPMNVSHGGTLTLFVQ